MERCVRCDCDLEPTEYYICALCADEEDQEAFEDFMNERFDMETEQEYKRRKENCW